MAADGKRCGVRLPAGRERVVVSAPICQNAIRRTMKALISTSRPIIFKWLLAVESNQSITDKILLKAALSVCLSHSLSLYLSLSLSCSFGLDVSAVTFSSQWFCYQILLLLLHYASDHILKWEHQSLSEYTHTNLFYTIINVKKTQVNYFHIYTHTYVYVWIREK